MPPDLDLPNSDESGYNENSPNSDESGYSKEVWRAVPNDGLSLAAGTAKERGVNGEHVPCSGFPNCQKDSLRHHHDGDVGRVYVVSALVFRGGIKPTHNATTIEIQKIQNSGRRWL